MKSYLNSISLYTMTAIICIGVIYLCFTIVPSTYRAPPSIEVVSSYEKPLHRPVSSISSINDDNHKRVIRPGSYFYIHREYIMSGNWSKCLHFSWILGVENGFYHKYQSQEVIDINKNDGVSSSFYYSVPNPIPLGKYELVTRVVCSMSPFKDDWKFDFPSTYFTVK